MTIINIIKSFIKRRDTSTKIVNFYYWLTKGGKVSKI